MRAISLIRLAALVWLPASCTVDVPMQSAWFTDAGIVSDKTESRIGTLTVTPAMERLTVDVDVRSENGAARWSLTDPSGVCRWRSDTAVAQHLEQHVTLDARPGDWTVHRDWQDFTGSQSFTVAAASSDRISITVSDVQRAGH